MNMLPELVVFGWRQHISHRWSKVWKKSVCQMATKVRRTVDASCSAAHVPHNSEVLPLPLAMPSDQKELHLGGAEILDCTVKALKEGHVVAVPTDTIYGLACLAQNSGAVKKIYDIKGRNGQKPLAICVGEIHDIYRYCKVNVTEELLSDLLPGPVTLVFERSEVLNKDLNPFTSLVGVRIPDHSFIRRLCQICEQPLALTSANISSHTSTLEVNEFKELWPKLAVVVDDGPIADQSRLGSTVVDFSVLGKYKLIRPGCAHQSTVDVLEHKYGLSEDSEK